MRILPSSLMRNVRSRNFFAWGLSFCLAGLALVASAQSQPTGQNPDTNAPVVIIPDTTTQPRPSVQMQPSPDLRDRWKIQKVSDEDDWTRHFRIGGMVGLNISANFSMNGKLFDIPGNNAANGIYDDGYVRLDNYPNSQGYTSYWGYNNASQLNGSDLIMHSTTSYSASGSSESSGSAFPGFDMSYGGNLFYLGRARIGWDLGFGLLPINISDNRSTPASVNQTVYKFNTGSIVVPTAPYQGGPSGLGANILTNYTSTPNVATAGMITGSHTLDVMLYTVRLGPSVYWDLGEDWGLSAAAGPAIGIMSGSLKYNETIVTASSVNNSGRVDGTDVVYGGYVNASLMYHLVENGDLYVGVQYMSLGNASISGGGREGRLNLGGQVYISAGINWPF
jgi:hypothetical protein